MVLRNSSHEAYPWNTGVDGIDWAKVDNDVVLQLMFLHIYDIRDPYDIPVPVTLVRLL